MKFQYYQDTAGRWRWRTVAANGRITSDGSEGYASKSNVIRAIRSHIEEVINIDGRADAIVEATT